MTHDPTDDILTFQVRRADRTIALSGALSNPAPTSVTPDKPSHVATLTLVTAAAQRPADYTRTSAQVGGDTVPTTLSLCINSERTTIVPGLTCTKNRLRTDFGAKPVWPAGTEHAGALG